MVLFSAIAPEAVRSGPVGLPRQLVEAVQSSESMLGRLPSSDEPCWLVAGRELEERPARSVAEPGVLARSPAAAGKEGELPGVYAKRSHAKRHLAARVT